MKMFTDKSFARINQFKINSYIKTKYQNKN